MSFLLLHQSDRKISNSRVKSCQTGFALVLVLWVISLLTIMAGSFALSMRRESTIVAGIKDNAGAIATAEAGIAFAEMMLLHPDQNKRWRADGNIYQVDFGTAKIRLRLFSEGGKIDINKANITLLQALLAQSDADEGKQAKIIAAIIDWRDKDDLTTLEGAEKNEYKSAGLKYQPRNKPFQSLEELQMVLGLDPKTYNWLLPYITVYSGQSQVNPKLASTKVLNVLPGLDRGLIESFVATRLESAKNDLPAPEFTAGLVANGGGGNEVVTIVSDALLDDNRSAVIIATVMKSDGTQGLTDESSQTAPFKVIEWQRNPINQGSLFSDEMSELLVKQYAEPELSD